MVFGLALVMALLFGVASTALGANGGSFILGKATNAATKVTGLVGKVAAGEALVVKNPSGGSALGLSVGDPLADPASKAVAPMKVDSQAKVGNLNADKIDGKDSNEFVQNSGETTFSVFGPWISGDPSVVTAQQGFNTTHFTNTATGTLQRNIRLNPSLPSSLYGKSMLLTGVELCYNTSNEGVALGRVELIRSSSTMPGSSSGNYVVSDWSPPDGAVCRTFSGTPQLMGTNSFAELQVAVNWSAQTSFYIQRATFFLEPSNNDAAPR